MNSESVMKEGEINTDEIPPQVLAAARKYQQKYRTTLKDALDVVSAQILRDQERGSTVRRDTGKRETRGDDEFEDIPLGPIAKKLMDVSQATTIAAKTQETLRGMRSPNPELVEIRETLKTLSDKVDRELKSLAEQVGMNKAEEERRRLLEEIDAKIKPLKEAVDRLTPKTESPEATVTGPATTTNSGKTMSITEIVTKINEEKEAAVRFLKELGIKVGENTSAKGDVTEEQMKKMLEERGYKVQDLRLTPHQIDEILKEERKKWEETAGPTAEIEKERIHATERFLNGLVDRLITEFLAPAKESLQTVIDRIAAQKRAVSENLTENPQ